jgi:hypothetical protein
MKTRHGRFKKTKEASRRLKGGYRKNGEEGK